MALDEGTGKFRGGVMAASGMIKCYLAILGFLWRRFFVSVERTRLTTLACSGLTALAARVSTAARSFRLETRRP